MLVSLSWLKEYIDVKLSVNEISEILTAIGLEVEGVEEKELIPGGLKGIVVGHVITCDKHPNADKLSLTTVNVGLEEPLQIVCGAPNVAAGQKVLIATVGAMLYPGEGEPFKIKKGKIRGEVSEGMICAEDELGLGNDHSGIIVLDEATEIGKAAAEVYNIENDTVFEIGLTPNRSDATCHLGVAEDLAAYIKINLDERCTIKKPSVTSFQVNDHTVDVDIVVENQAACPRYSGICLTDVTVQESPEWLKKRLISIDQRPINNIVDITNFILHELGQPLHAFDLDKIESKEVRVKNLADGTPFLSLDEQERKLHHEDLMICDGGDNPMCIGGVFGGLNSGVTESTTSIFLESAHFEAKSIRRSMTRHGLWTDAARVFEKGSDPNNTIYALKRATNLIVELAGATVSSDIYDVYNSEIKPKEIHLRYEKLNNLIGDNIPKDLVHNILSAMNMEVKPVDEFGIKVHVPTNKSDVIREVDLAEEVLRIYGFNKVSIPTNVSSAIQYSAYPNKHTIVNLVSDYLATNGWNEMMGLSLMESKKCIDAIGIDESKLVFINNTSNIHLDVMRPDMLISGLQSVVHNQNHQQQNCRLFELGKTYQKEDDAFVEKQWLSFYLKGDTNNKTWRTPQNSQVELADLQGVIVGLLGRLGLTHNKLEEVEDSRFDFCISYFVHNKPLFKVGIPSRKILKTMDVKGQVFFAECDVLALLDAVKRRSLKIAEISKFPSSSRDLALVLDNKVKFAQIEKLTNKTEKKLIKSIELFDIYVNEEQLGAGKKSYAVNYLFEDVSKTLQDKEIEKVMNKLIYIYKEQLGAEIRQ